MKIVILGSNGQLGRELLEEMSRKPRVKVIGFSKKELDVSNYSEVSRMMELINPDVVINTAAFTNVDDCEIYDEKAYEVNAMGPRNLALCSKKLGYSLIQISTDFIFDGNKRIPYVETDTPAPLSVYGKTKLAGEKEIEENCESYFIIRTSWLYGKYGNNFVKTIVKLSNERENLSIVNDQFGTPTYTQDLISFIEKCIHSKAYGIYHFSNEGNCSWNEFSRAIVELIDRKIDIRAIKSIELNRRALRPSYSVLDKTKVKSVFLISIRSWKDALNHFISSEIKKGGK